jgi:hypothetical protein
MTMIKLSLIISWLFLVILLLMLPISVEAATVCSYAGPDVSLDLLRLSNFTVNGSSNLKVGDTITVKFTLENYGQYDLNLGQKGIFVAARDPDNSDSSFGFSFTNTTFEYSGIRTVTLTKYLDKAGTWKVWPSYHLSLATSEKFGPDEWHVCTFQVSPIIQDLNPPAVTIFHFPSNVNTSSQVTFVAKARDEANVTKILIYVNNTQVKECSGNALTKGSDELGEYWSCSYTGGPYDRGALTYMAEAFDSFDNKGSSDEKSLTISSLISTPPVQVTGCLLSIHGRLSNFHYDRRTVGFELCEAVFLSPSSRSGGVEIRPGGMGLGDMGLGVQFVQGAPVSEPHFAGWVCKPDSTPIYVNLSSHDTYRFDNLCPGIYKITPFYQHVEDECPWSGRFWDSNRTHSGYGIVNVSESNSYDFVFEPVDDEPPEVEIKFSPENPVTAEDVQIIITANDSSGIKKIKLTGEVTKHALLRGHCRTEEYRGREVEICEEFDYESTGSFSRECLTSTCTYTIPKNTSLNFTRYEISIDIDVYDNACNKIRLFRNFTIPSTRHANFSIFSVRNMSSYRDREVFMVSDRDWRTVLSLMPIAYGCVNPPLITTYEYVNNTFFQIPEIGEYECSNKVRHPLIIFHQEESGPYLAAFDIDSAIHFMSKYRPERLTVFIGNESLNPTLDDHIVYWLMYPHTVLPNTGVATNLYDTYASARFFLDASNASKLYKYYFSEINSVMISEDKYEIGLLASVLASRLDIPLYFDGHFDPSDIENKTVHIAGNIRSSTMRLIQEKARQLGKFAVVWEDWCYDSYGSFKCLKSEKYESPYSIEALRSGPGPSILVNPQDINTSSQRISESSYLNLTIRPKTTNMPVRVFGKNSLAAPVYAAARGGRIVFSPYTGVAPGDSFCGPDSRHGWVRNIIDQIKANVSGVSVIIADPANIPDSYYTGCIDGWQTRRQVDREYGRDSVGRIYGLTVTDTSAYIARSIFYDDIISHEGSIPGLIIAHTISADEDDAYRIFQDLRDSRDYHYNVSCYIGSGRSGCIRNTTAPASEYLGKNFIIFMDHGGPYVWWSTLETWEIPNLGNNMYLDLPVVFGDACLTNNFWEGGENTMGPNWIRNGAMAYFGAVGVTSGPDCISGYSYKMNAKRFSEYISSDIIQPYDLGTISGLLSVCVEQCCGSLRDCWMTDCAYKNDYIMLGDPLLIPRLIDSPYWRR